jgi:hypothetical protein
MERTTGSAAQARARGITEERVAAEVKRRENMKCSQIKSERIISRKGVTSRGRPGGAASYLDNFRSGYIYLHSFTVITTSQNTPKHFTTNSHNATATGLLFAGLRLLYFDRRNLNRRTSDSRACGIAAALVVMELRAMELIE